LIHMPPPVDVSTANAHAVNVTDPLDIDFDTATAEDAFEFIKARSAFFKHNIEQLHRFFLGSSAIRGDYSREMVDELYVQLSRGQKNTRPDEEKRVKLRETVEMAYYEKRRRKHSESPDKVYYTNVLYPDAPDLAFEYLFYHTNGSPKEPVLVEIDGDLDKEPVVFNSLYMHLCAQPRIQQRFRRYMNSVSRTPKALKRTTSNDAETNATPPYTMPLKKRKCEW
jgi:hypothetical protein